MGILYLVRHGQANSGGLHTSDVADGAMEETYDRLTPLGHEQAAATGRSLAARIGGAGRGAAEEGAARVSAAREGAAQESAAGESAAQPVVLSGPLGRQLSTAESVHAELEAAGLEPQAIRMVEQWREFSSDDVLAPYFRAHPDNLAEIRRAYETARDNPRGMKEHNRLLGRAIDAALREWRSTPAFDAFSAQVRQGFSDATSLAAGGQPVVVVTSGGPISMCAAELIGADWTRLINNIFTASVSVFSVRSAGKAQLLSFNEHAHLDIPDASGSRPLRRYR